MKKVLLIVRLMSNYYGALQFNIEGFILSRNLNHNKRLNADFTSGYSLN